MVVHAYNPGAGRLRQKNLSCSLANQTSLSFRFSERPCLKKKKKKVESHRKTTQLGPLCVCVYVHHQEWYTFILSCFPYHTQTNRMQSTKILSLSCHCKQKEGCPIS